MKVTLLDQTPYGEYLAEKCGRICWRSGDKIAEGSTVKFLRNIKGVRHFSVLGHMRFLFLLDYGNESPVEALGDITYLLSSHPTAQFIRITNADPLKGKFWMSGTAKSFLCARGIIADAARAELRVKSPVVFSNFSAELAERILEPLAVVENVQLWSLFLPDMLPFSEQLIHGALTFYLHDVHRNLTHQLVRHGAVYSQASQRYCGEENFGYYMDPGIYQVDTTGDAERTFKHAMEDARSSYAILRGKNVPKEIARDVLPGACHTEIAATMTLENFANMCYWRTDSHAQGPIRRVADIISDLARAQVYKQTDEIRNWAEIGERYAQIAEASAQITEE